MTPTTIRDLLSMVIDRVDPAGLVDRAEMERHVRRLVVGRYDDHRDGSVEMAALCDAVMRAIDPHARRDARAYRAAAWTRDDGQGGVVLTAADEMALDEADLLSSARAEMERAGMTGDGGSVSVQYWRD